MSTVARWSDWIGEGLEHLVLREIGDRIVALSYVIGQVDGAHFAARYLVECDLKWRTRKVRVTMAGSGGEVFLLGTGRGSWLDAEGTPLPVPQGAIDVDITCTPFTNTLPVRRLGLEAGQSADIVVAYIDVPSLNVTADPQRYTCLEPMRRYRFESLDSDFTREIEVDEHGLVVLYPGLFRRVL
jgi:hypothetical protein